MRTEDFDYHLPQELIAQHPTEKRDDSRLLVVGKNGSLVDAYFCDIADYLAPADLLVLNDTRVIPARLFAQKDSGGKVEIMLERIVDSDNIVAQLRVSKSPNIGSELLVRNEAVFQVKSRTDDMFYLRFIGAGELSDFLQQHGHMPLPPYINRDDSSEDQERYQTVYANKPGAVAAPTAGLHFTNPLLERLSKQGVANVRLTLHIGAGTFQPVRVDNVNEHKMHSEYMQVPDDVVQAIRQTKQNGGRIVAVGTTVVRSLEAAAQDGELKPFDGETSIFIYPGFRFNMVDMLLTNFHLPQSTLLMLVSAFSVKSIILNAYQHAVDKRYRFFSYGDAMLLE